MLQDDAMASNSLVLICVTEYLSVHFFIFIFSLNIYFFNSLLKSTFIIKLFTIYFIYYLQLFFFLIILLTFCFVHFFSDTKIFLSFIYPACVLLVLYWFQKVVLSCVDFPFHSWLYHTFTGVR